MDERRYCALLAPDEPLAGTADPVDVWLLLEYRPTWRARPVEDNDLADAVQAWFDGMSVHLAERGLKARPQFIRQPEREDDRLRLLVGFAGSLYQFEANSYHDLMVTPVAELVADPQSYADQRLLEPAYFVCTNGQRDLCCARFGLPVHGALRERLPGRVWQATHLGGHRFAANVLVMPQSTLYGRVTEEAVDGLLADTEVGSVHLPLLRGCHAYSQPAQAAHAALLASDGQGWTLDLRDGADVDDETGTGERVTFRRGGDQVVFEVRRAADPDFVLKSCADPETKPVYAFEVERVRS